MRKYFAELIGTFALVFCGTGSVIVNSLSEGSLGLLGIAASFGIIVTAMIYSIGGTSGAHLNPAVSIALALGKRLPKNDLLGYILAQCLGAFLASGLLYIIFPETKTYGETLPAKGILSSVVLEFVLTFFLMFTILGVTAKKDTSILAGIVIGVLVTGIILVAGPISGGSFNPARSLAPAVISGNIHSLWIYILAPIAGAISASFCWNTISNT